MVSLDPAGRQAGKGDNVGRQRFLSSIFVLIFPRSPFLLIARSEGDSTAPRGRAWVSKTRF